MAGTALAANVQAMLLLSVAMVTVQVTRHMIHVLKIVTLLVSVMQGMLLIVLI